jgi:ribosomal protein RSM22 (predicted rRNA methylase)
MFGVPEVLLATVATELAGYTGSRRSGVSSLSATYRSGGTSIGIDFAAYLTARLPATYAAVAKVLAEVARLRPGWAPASVLDAGSGPGTASWAAVALWPDIERAILVDNDAEFLAMAGRLAAQAEASALRSATSLCRAIGDPTPLPAADLAIAAYALAEMAEDEQRASIDRLWGAAETLVIVEPGTPAGFARILAARSQVLGQGARVIGPCPHENACPIAAPDWCHFSVRLPRSRAHMHAKAAQVPFEDEKFCWLAASRLPAARAAARVIKPPRQTKVEIVLPLCTENGLETRRIPRRDKPAHAAARKLDWGDAL